MIRKILSLLLALTAFLGLFTIPAMASEDVTESGNPPYAQIEYDYSSEVQCGTIRFINQIISGPLFCSDYWQEWEWKYISGVYYGPGSECGTACMSMALSYVGVNKTPNDILDYGDGLTYFKDWGDASVSKLPVSDFYAAMENYINGNGRYSPPVIHLPNYSNRGHYVVVIGKIDDETYEILDPNNCAVTTMTISGSSAKYDKHGYTIYDRIDSLTQWFNPNAGPAVIKKAYPSACVLKTTDKTSVMSLPCWMERNQESQILGTLEKEQTLHTTELILNDWNEYWYKLELPDVGTCYVPAGKTEYQKNDPAQVTISNVASPNVLVAGDYFSLEGKIKAGNSLLTKVSVYVRKGSGLEGELCTSGSAEVNSNTFNLAELDSQVRFGKLSAGNYTYIIEAQYANYYSKDGAVKSYEETVILHEVIFVVEQPVDREPPAQPVPQIEVENDQVSINWQETAHTTHYHLSLQRKNADGEWEDLETVEYASSGVTRTLEIGAYRAQLIAYNENAYDDEIEPWHYTTASSMAEFAVECAHEFDDGVVAKEATCKEAGVMCFTCTHCGKVREEPIAQLQTHTPGPAATETEAQVCLVCNTVLQEAIVVTEPSEPELTQETIPATEPIPETQEEDVPDIGAVLALVLLSVIGVCAVFFDRKYGKKPPQEEEKTEEMQKTQS